MAKSKVEKLAAKIVARGGRVEQGNLIMPLTGKVTGFDGQELRKSTPLSVQAAANEYFDRKQEVEKAKDRMVTSLAKIEAEMKATNTVVCVVRSIDGESMTCRIKSSSKLEIKRLK